MAKANDYYADVAKQYDKVVFKKIQKELVDQVLTALFPCFDCQLKSLRQQAYLKVEQEVKKLERKEMEEICEQLSDILNALHTNSIKSFDKKAESLVIEGSGWSTKVEAHRVDLLTHLTTLVTNCKDRLLIKLSQTA